MRSVRLGPLHLRFVRRSDDAAPFRFDAAECLQRLGELACSLRGLPWMVVSGLVEPLIRGRFSRSHGDVDIAAPAGHLGPVVAALVRHGYLLTTRVLRTHLDRAWDLELHLRIAPALLALRRRRLRLWRTDAHGRFDEGRFPRYVGLYAYRLDGRELEVLDTGWRLRFPGSIAMSVELPGGRSIPVERPGFRRVASGT
jgi:hypothetical protein